MSEQQEHQSPDPSHTYLIEPDYQVKALSKTSQRIVAALIEGIVPNSVRFNFDYERELVGFFDEFIGYLPRLVRLVFPLGLRLINWSSIFTFGRPITMLKAAQSEKHFLKLMDSPIYLIREGVKGIKGLALMGFYSHPEVQRHIGYLPQPWLDQKVAERVSRFGLRVPDLHEIAAAPGGPAGVVIRGSFDEQMQPGDKVAPYRQAWTMASATEIESAIRAAEQAKLDAQNLGQRAEEERQNRPKKP